MVGHVGNTRTLCESGRRRVGMRVAVSESGFLGSARLPCVGLYQVGPTHLIRAIWGLPAAAAPPCPSYIARLDPSTSRAPLPTTGFPLGEADW
jgi:hypothetical protein